MNPMAGKAVPRCKLVDLPKLLSAYYTLSPDPENPDHRIDFGTSGHRGSSLIGSFNEAHILAIAQAICDYRRTTGVEGPLFLGRDTHALSAPAQMTAVEVFAANGVQILWAGEEHYTPTPLVSFAILRHNQNQMHSRSALADGVIVTPSHNPPEDGGFKYNPPHGGPASTETTAWIQNRANELLATGLSEVRRMGYERALDSDLLKRHDFITPYVRALAEIVDLSAVQSAGLRIAADALGGSAMEVYHRINELYDLDMTILHDYADPRFSFMPPDHDGTIRMDCSSPQAMADVCTLKDRYDLVFANDPDADRHGIVTPTDGLMNPNHFLSVAAGYLFATRLRWSRDARLAKTLVSSSMIDKVARSLGREIYETPVGFKWFSRGLLDGDLAFGGEESAGASFVRYDGSVWTTDKDGILMAMLAAEITAGSGRDPARHYREYEERFGPCHYGRIDAPANREQKALIKSVDVRSLKLETFAGSEVEAIYTRAPGNHEPFGGLKVITPEGWAALRPSGTEEIYKIYAESFRSGEHLLHLQEEAQRLVDSIFAHKESHASGRS